ncbi:YggT family protein [Marinilactibacillus psychrotolerans]|uniref:YggT family protein n=1 Tax=Marinilactibacillus psychrotolerans TaxID=191770 RepID=UPI0038844B5C
MLLQFISYLYSFLINLIDIYRLLLVVYFLMSWLPGAYQSGVGRLLTRICEPYVGFFRRFVPPIGMISLAGLVALFALSFIKMGIASVFNILVNLLSQLGLL